MERDRGEPESKMGGCRRERVGNKPFKPH